MTGPQYYVATDGFGLERLTGDHNQWTVPAEPGEPSVALVRPDGAPLVLRNAAAILDVLDEVIWVAEPIDSVITPPESGELHVHSARLVRRTPWDPTTAARFALDCAEHAIGSGATVELPNGRTIGEVIIEARTFLDSASDPGSHLGLLARLATIRRLKRENNLVTDLVYGLSVEDINTELETALDASWTSAASVADSLFAALEALRHLAFPRYVRAREAVAVEQETNGEVPPTPAILSTPWGSIALGGEHESPYLPAAVCAREAAVRAREAVRDRNGAAGEELERSWQAALLAQVLV